jgi:hypothetical protein
LDAAATGQDEYYYAEFDSNISTNILNENLSVHSQVMNETLLPFPLIKRCLLKVQSLNTVLGPTGAGNFYLFVSSSVAVENRLIPIKS